MVTVDKIFKKGEKHEATGFEFVSFVGKAIWGINNKGEYKAFSRKYYLIVEVEIEVKKEPPQATTDWYY